jgi:hypothetical protein
LSARVPARTTISSAVRRPRIYRSARFITPGGSLTFNGFHQGYIAVLCTVDNPRYHGTQRWNQLHVTYRDPDGLRTLEGYGLDYQVYVELVRISKATGALRNLPAQRGPWRG